MDLSKKPHRKWKTKKIGRIDNEEVWEDSDKLKVPIHFYLMRSTKCFFKIHEMTSDLVDVFIILNFSNSPK